MTDEYTPNWDFTLSAEVCPDFEPREPPVPWWTELVTWVWGWVEKVWEKVTGSGSE